MTVRVDIRCGDMIVFLCPECEQELASVDTGETIDLDSDIEEAARHHQCPRSQQPR